MAKERSQRPANMAEVERRLKGIATECGTRFYLEDPPDTWRETHVFASAGQAHAEPVPGPNSADTPAEVPAPGPAQDSPGDVASPFLGTPDGVHGANASDLLHHVSEELALVTSEPQPEQGPESFSGRLSEFVPRRRLLRPLVLAGLGLAALLALLAFVLIPGGDTRAGAGRAASLPTAAPGPGQVAATPAASPEPEHRDLARPDISPPDQGRPSRQGSDARPPESKPNVPTEVRARKPPPGRVRKPTPRRKEEPVFRALPAHTDDLPEPTFRALPPSPEETPAP